MSEDLLPVQLLPLLTVVGGPLRGTTFRLRPGVGTIGRKDGSDILLEDIQVSRRHATVELVDGRVQLTDAGSTNGTWINAQRLSGSARLRDGDRIRVGNVELRYFDPGEANTDPVGTIHYALPAMLAAQPVRDTGHPVSGALAGPTQAVDARQTPRRLVTIGGVVLLAGSLAWGGYLAFG